MWDDGQCTAIPKKNTAHTHALFSLFYAMHAAMFSTLDAASGLDDSARKAFNRRLNPVVDLAAAAQDRLTSNGYGLAHNSARSELVRACCSCCCAQRLCAGSPCQHCLVCSCVDLAVLQELAHLQDLHRQPNMLVLSTARGVPVRMTLRVAKPHFCGMCTGPSAGLCSLQPTTRPGL